MDSVDIKNAYHAVALDEHRKPFSPTLWHLPADGVAEIRVVKTPSSELRAKWEKIRNNANATEQQLSDAWMDLVDAEMYEELKGTDSNLLQVWFPGVHINIGGGNDDLLTKKESDFERESNQRIFQLYTLSPFILSARPVHRCF